MGLARTSDGEGDTHTHALLRHSNAPRDMEAGALRVHPAEVAEQHALVDNDDAAINKKPLPPAKPRWRRDVIAVVIVSLAFLCVHLVFVALLRETTFAVQQLTVPDLCHRQSVGDLVVRFQNPSYCSPEVGPLQITITKNDTRLLQLSIPSFVLQPRISTVVARTTFELLATPEQVHDVVFRQDGAFAVSGEVVIRISCLLIPFTISLDFGSLPVAHDTEPSTKEVNAWGGTVGWLGRLPPPLGDFFTSELERLVKQIMHTVALTHIRTIDDETELAAFTDISFDYVSSVVWNVPALAMQLMTNTRQTILTAGVERFLLGDGQTFISFFSEILKKDTAPLQDMLQSYLVGNDLTLHVQGNNTNTTCLSLQVLDLIDFQIDVPATIDGQPALLRKYSVIPTLKELNSKTRTCLLKVDVSIWLRNPLPIHFTLYDLAFDLSYQDSRHPEVPMAFLSHIDDQHAVSWAAHDVHNISLSTSITDFDVCKNLFGAYAGDGLVFSLQHGFIHMAVGSGNITVPFHVNRIPIHPFF